MMDWCDANDVGFILGLSGNPVLAAQVEPTADAVRTRRAIGDLDAVRDWTIMARSRGQGLAASPHASRPHGRVSISAMSSPTSAAAPRGGCMSASTAPAAWRRT
jgi:hypothetical protein